MDENINNANDDHYIIHPCKNDDTTLTLDEWTSIGNKRFMNIAKLDGIALATCSNDFIHSKIVSKSYKLKGLSDNTTEILMSSISTSTRKQYYTGLKLWRIFCQQSKITIYHFSVPVILKFLSELFEKRIKRFFKGVYNARPLKPKYNDIWDPEIVLNYLSTQYPNENISLENLTLKLVTLLALGTAQRVQTLSLIDLRNISQSDDEIRIKIPGKIKTSGPSKAQPLLKIPYFSNKPSLCIAKTLQCYILRTSIIRNNNTNLLISYKKPHNTVTTSTISRWIKTTLLRSGIDTTIFTAHSTRHASTSAALRKGISMDLIKHTAGWSANSATFAKFYNRPLREPNHFTKMVMRHYLIV
ncbi:hypothetical protein NQ317_011150 [Molorchus minor]|uniref:Tyr recombinase domain-containing protein n=1 Tax=Molorchus minor TaxID=1323400 RepID=A0ABQ9JGU8_9CUCU|nr:hypothetical protein NQ317_011150 [Molorchus minor]